MIHQFTDIFCPQTRGTNKIRSIHPAIMDQTTNLLGLKSFPRQLRNTIYRSLHNRMGKRYQNNASQTHLCLFLQRGIPLTVITRNTES
ncbi:hypothetical protein CDAR_63821 [Caerostris darwini]|uniref:Uncharacterized protein n=1 Tax=Caerostris darwini TaxID=1538125 RepID=A0AAV4R058_9ARAC|nr:hypothetical protein CDAR_63821 [Caerostris darwini]